LSAFEEPKCPIVITLANLTRHTLEAASVEFIDENGGGAGVRLKKSLTVSGAAWSASPR